MNSNRSSVVFRAFAVRSATKPCFAALAVAVAWCSASMPATAGGGVAGVGMQVFDSAWNEEPFVQVAAGFTFSAALRANGTLVVFGDNGHGQASVPALPPGLSYTDV